MSFCMHCAAVIHETATCCRKCGGVQKTHAEAPATASTNTGQLWMPITSLVTGILGACTLFADSTWDEDEIAGVLMLFVAPSVVVGAIALARDKAGKGMAVVGLVLGAITGAYVLAIAGKVQ